jgi:hypothetical protein
MDGEDLAQVLPASKASNVAANHLLEIIISETKRTVQLWPVPGGPPHVPHLGDPAHLQ